MQYSVDPSAAGTGFAVPRNDRFAPIASQKSKIEPSSLAVFPRNPWSSRRHAVMLGVLSDHLRLDSRCQWWHALDACRHRCLLRKAGGHLDATIIGEPRPDRKARHPIVGDCVYEVAVAIRTYSSARQSKRIGMPVHFQ